ncbi:MAG: hypothetical protein SVO01_12300 [Thermotogota bacterium]|nr:hypothetical protein [Thermotogota bacterium]
MEDKRIIAYHGAKEAREKAEEWNNLPHGRKYQDDTFDISVAQSKVPSLIRIGQQKHGGQNYWESNSKFNQAILEYLVSTWDEHFPRILNILKEKEQKALKDCQSYIDEMQSMIDEV